MSQIQAGGVRDQCKHRVSSVSQGVFKTVENISILQDKTDILSDYCAKWSIPQETPRKALL